MGLMDNLTTDKDIQKDGDFLGGYSPFESGLVTFTIKLAFLTQSAKKALALNLHLESDDKRLLKQQIYMTSNEAKGCKNYYMKDKKKHYLPGFNQANSLANLILGKDLNTIGTAEKTINLYDPNQKKEAPQKVEMLMDLLGKRISCGLVKQIVDVKTFHEGTNTYVATGKTRIENEVNKFFHAESGLTVTEMNAGVNKPIFQQKWAAKWDNLTLDKSTAPKGNAGGNKTPEPNGTTAPTTNLFED